MTDGAIVFTDTPDNIDYPKLRAAHKQAIESECAVMVHNVCHECPSITTVPPGPVGEVHHVIFRHEPWCPVLALHEGRELTESQKRRHRRYMDSK